MMMMTMVKENDSKNEKWTVRSLGEQNYVRYQVLTATSMKMTAFWDSAPFIFIKID
jgi:hypothetical protein